MSKQIKRRVRKIVSGLSCVMFLQATLFPFVVSAQVMVSIPTAVSPIVAVPIHLPLVLPSVLEKEKFVNVPDISFSFSRTDYVSLSRPSQKRDVRAYLSQGVLPGYIGINTPRPRPEVQQRLSAWAGIIDGSFDRGSLAGFLLAEAPQPFAPPKFKSRLRFGLGAADCIGLPSPFGLCKPNNLAENRLITAAPTAPVVNDKKLDFVYDYQGRRVQKIVSNWNGSSWVIQTTKRFVYDGWNVIEEQTVSQPSKYYVWGLDLSQSLQGAGGIGGLLARIEGTSTHNFLYDGNGNVGQLVNASSGVVDAHYEYDPYGNSIVATGSQATANPYRFSTKYLDTESNLYYYGYRYYDPNTGRWLSRDPIEEDGGLNLYAFVLNNSINSFDALGQQTGVLESSSTSTRPLYYSDFERAIKASSNTSKSLFQKAYRGISQKLGIVIYALLRIEELTSEEACLKLIVDNFKKTYSLADEEVQALSTLILAASQGKDDIVKQFQDRRRLPIFWVAQQEWPNIYEHTNAFINRNFGGRMQVLHYESPEEGERSETKRRRVKRALDAIAPGRSEINNNLDEYPMASTIEGGNTSVPGVTISVKWVPASENKSHGGALGSRVYRRYQMKTADPFLVITVPREGIR